MRYNAYVPAVIISGAFKSLSMAAFCDSSKVNNSLCDIEKLFELWVA
jgi:hypothetical protein